MPSDVALRNPFSLTAAMRFALLFAAVLLVVKLVERYAPGRGVYVVAALAGTTDVDAITLSMATSARDGAIDAGTATIAIVVAALVNTLVKGALVAGARCPGSRRTRRARVRGAGRGRARDGLVGRGPGAGIAHQPGIACM